MDDMVVLNQTGSKVKVEGQYRIHKIRSTNYCPSCGKQEYDIRSPECCQAPAVAHCRRCAAGFYAFEASPVGRLF